MTRIPRRQGVGFKQTMQDLGGLAITLAIILTPPLAMTWVLMLVLGNAAHAGIIAVAPDYSAVFGIFSPVYVTIMVVWFVVKVLR